MMKPHLHTLEQFELALEREQELWHDRPDIHAALDAVRAALRETLEHEYTTEDDLSIDETQ